jgi:cellulase/cellobiase CelA1
VISLVAGILARGIAPLAVVALAGAGVLAEPIQSIPAPAIRLVEGSNPLAGKPFYVDPISSAMLCVPTQALGSTTAHLCRSLSRASRRASMLGESGATLASSHSGP